MTRLRSILLATGFLAVSVPHVAFGALFSGSIIPQTGSCVCPGSAPDYGCVLQVLQNVINFAVYIGIILCVFWIAYAGFSMMLSGSNATAKSIAKTRLLNAAVGIAVILCSWIIVDFVMKTLYNPDTVFQANIFGPWNSILAPDGDSFCIVKTTPLAITQGTLGIISGNPGATSGTYSTGTGTGACNPSQVAAAAASGGYQLSTQQANALACIAKPESACGANTTGARTTGGQQTSAGGPWQNLLGASDKCHSLNIPACGNLNCSAAYSGGRAKGDAASQALAQKCQQAINNLTCAASAAACLVEASGGKFSAWTADSRSSTQKACVSANGLRY